MSHRLGFKRPTFRQKLQTWVPEALVRETSMNPVSGAVDTARHRILNSNVYPWLHELS